MYYTYTDTSNRNDFTAARAFDFPRTYGCVVDKYQLTIVMTTD